MCLVLRVVPDREGTVSARRLSAASGLHVTKRDGAFSIAREPGCSCSMAVDGAQWPLDPAVLEPLANALALFGRGFTFVVTFDGESAVAEKRVRRAAFLRSVREGSIETGFTYRVS